MQRQRGELIPIGEVVSGLDGPVKELCCILFTPRFMPLRLGWVSRSLR